MKRRSLSALLALSLLSLISCGSRQISTSGDTTADVELPQTQQTEQIAAVEQTEPTAPAGPAAVPDYSSAEALRRPEHAWVYYYYSVRDEDGSEEMSPDGAEMQKAEATLYIGDGYSIYILDDEWVYQAGTMGGRNVDIWKPILSENEDTELRIVKMGGNGFSEAQAWVREQYPDYELYEDNKRGLGGVDLPFPNTTVYFDASFCPLGDDLYAVIQIQPIKEKHYDRFMYQMRAMMDTLRPFFYFPTAGELGRPEHTQLSYRAGGEEIVSEASLYIGNSYSIYLPDEGWTRQTDIVENDTVGAWKSTLHDGVELRIENRGHYIDWIRERNPGYVFTEEENGEIIGENAEGFRMEVSQISITIHGKTAEYTIYKVYPVVDTEESERIKVSLDAMTDTFEPFENAVHYSLLF